MSPTMRLIVLWCGPIRQRYIFSRKIACANRDLPRQINSNKNPCMPQGAGAGPAPARGRALSGVLDCCVLGD